MQELSQFSVPGCEGVFYVPNFVNADEEQYIIRQINNAPKPKWKSLMNRRLQVWGGEITSSGKLLQQPLPAFLNRFPDIVGRLRETGAFAPSAIGRPNHVIVNEYLPGQGIMPHEDGPRYHPVVCTVSLGSHTVFNYYQYTPEDSSDELVKEGDSSLMTSGNNKSRAIDTQPILSLLLEPRSLIITTSSFYTSHLHGIEPLEEDVLSPQDYSDDGTQALASDSVDKGDSDALPIKIRIANWSLLADGMERETAIHGGILRRGTRVSLTCRSVEQVFKARKASTH